MFNSCSIFFWLLRKKRFHLFVYVLWVWFMQTCIKSLSLLWIFDFSAILLILRVSILYGIYEVFIIEKKFFLHMWISFGPSYWLSLFMGSIIVILLLVFLFFENECYCFWKSSLFLHLYSLAKIIMVDILFYFWLKFWFSLVLWFHLLMMINSVINIISLLFLY